MHKRKLALVLLCVVCSAFFSSCVKKTLETAATPAIAVGRGIATFGRVLFGSNKTKKKTEHTPHTHKEAPAIVPAATEEAASTPLQNKKQESK